MFLTYNVTLLTLTHFYMLLSLPKAIIEHVRDGSVVRALLLPDYYLVTVMLSGVKVTSPNSYAAPTDVVKCEL